MTESSLNLTPRCGDRSLFPRLGAKAYLAHAAITPPAAPVLEAVRRTLDEFAELGSAAFPRLAERRERLRDKLATLLGARPHDLALLGGTTSALVSLALSIPWKAGDRIVLFQGEFPANITPWRQAAKLYRLDARFLPLAGALLDTGGLLERLEQQLKQGARLVATSAVQFQTGLRMPLAEMAELCHRHGAELAVDAIQAAGVMPLDVGALGLDYVAGGAHKWLMGIEGAGYLYVRPERVAALKPVTAGWLSHENPLAFLVEGAGLLDYESPLKRTAEVFEAGSSSVASFAALDAALDMLLSLGTHTIFQHVSNYLDALTAGFEQRGLSHTRASTQAGRSAIVSIQPPSGVPMRQLAKSLGERGVTCSTPDGYLRFAPHFPNPLREVDSVLEVLDECLERLTR